MKKTPYNRKQNYNICLHSYLKQIHKSKLLVKLKYRLISVWVHCNEELSQKRWGKFISIFQVYVFKIIEFFHIKEKIEYISSYKGFIKIWHEINSSETHL